MSDSESSLSEAKKRKGEEGYFQRSKRTQRTPTKAKMEDKENETSTTEIFRQMLTELKGVRREQSEIKESLERNNNELRALREDIKIMNEKWENKFREMENRFQNIEVRVENIEKEKRKNNIVITGIEIKEYSRETQKHMQEWMNRELGIDSKIKETRKIT